MNYSPSLAEGKSSIIPVEARTRDTPPSPHTISPSPLPSTLLCDSWFAFTYPLPVHPDYSSFSFFLTPSHFIDFFFYSYSIFFFLLPGWEPTWLRGNCNEPINLCPPYGSCYEIAETRKSKFYSRTICSVVDPVLLLSVATFEVDIGRRYRYCGKSKWGFFGKYSYDFCINNFDTT